MWRALHIYVYREKYIQRNGNPIEEGLCGDFWDTQYTIQQSLHAKFKHLSTSDGSLSPAWVQKVQMPVFITILNKRFERALFNMFPSSCNKKLHSVSPNKSLSISTALKYNGI